MPRVKRWIDEVREVYEELGGVAHYSDVYRRIIERAQIDLSKNNNWQAAVRRTVEQYSSDSEAYSGGEDHFYSVEGKGRGIWGLRYMIPDTPLACDSQTQNEQVERMELNTFRYVRDTRISKELKHRYNHFCQICGYRLQIGVNSYYSEAHHIQPLGQGHNGPDVKENLIILCPNHHAEFDYGVMAIDPETHKVCHSNPLDRYHGIQLRSDHKIGDEFLRYHFYHIFKQSF